MMPIFAAEKADGLEDAIVKGGRLSYAALALPNSTPSLPSSIQPYSKSVGTNLGQDDLYYLKSILASTGMNKNDDYFERIETWAARKTPEDKPFNFEHKQDDNIGHITACSAIDIAGKAIEDATAHASLPDKFHLYTTAVLYKYCDIPDRQKRMDTILDELAEGKLYVSMECLFKGFDYLLIPKSAASADYDLASASIVERNDKTAFLTKHLRAYGGKGKWNDHKVGRVLLNIVFHGKGLVRKPANPESVIFTMENEPLSGAAAKIMQLPAESGYKTDVTEKTTGSTSQKESKDMNEIDTLKAQVAELTTKLHKAEAAIKDADSKQVEQLKAELIAAHNAIKASEVAKVETDKAVKASEDKVVAAEAKLAIAEKASVEAKAAIAKIEDERKFEKRLNEVKAAYKVTDEAEAKDILDGLIDLSDEKFNKVIAKHIKLGESKVTNLPAPMAGEVKTVKTVTATEALAQAEPKVEPALATTGETDKGFEQTQADVLAYFDKE